MPIQYLFQGHEAPEGERIILLYLGAMTQQMVVDQSQFVKDALAGCKSQRSVFSVFVEMAQNVLKYSAVKEQVGNTTHPSGVGVILIRESPDAYILSAGNPIDQGSVEALTHRLNEVCSLDKSSLRELFKKRRRSGITTERGAGLGLLDIAKRPGTTLSYEFFPYDTNKVPFAMTVEIPKGGSA